MAQQLLPAIIIVVAGVISVLLLGYGITTARSGTTEELQERLSRYAGAAELEPERAGELSRRQSGRLAQVVERAVAERSFTANIRQQLARADLRLTVGEWLIIRVTAVFLGFVFGFLLGAATNGLTLLTGLGLAVLGFFAPGWYIKYRIRRRVNQFIRQLGDTITLMANSLRAGYSLMQAMELVSRESPPPISDEFRRVVHEVGLGIPSQQAMAHLLRRIPSDDLDLLITAINIQYEVGGNLAQILDIIGHTIRERVRIKGEIAVLTAQQSISGYVITGLPIVLAIILFLIAPSYIGGMFRFPWICMPIGSGIMIIIGFFVMRKITDIEV